MKRERERERSKGKRREREIEKERERREEEEGREKRGASFVRQDAVGGEGFILMRNSQQL